MLPSVFLTIFSHYYVQEITQLIASYEKKSKYIHAGN